MAQAVTEYLVNKNVNSIITSHFSEMKKLAYELSEVENAFVEFDKETLSPTYHWLLELPETATHLISVGGLVCRRVY